VAFLNGKATTRLIVLYAPEAKTLYRGLRLKRFHAPSKMAIASSGVAQGELGDGVVPVVDGEAQPGEREEDAENGGDRPVMSRRLMHGTENRSRLAA
jgi:hypothetical protein